MNPRLKDEVLALPSSTTFVKAMIQAQLCSQIIRQKSSTVASSGPRRNLRTKIDA